MVGCDAASGLTSDGLYESYTKLGIDPGAIYSSVSIQVLFIARYRSRCRDMCIEMCADTCTDMRTDTCADTRTDMCRDKCADMCTDTCVDMCPYICTDMYV